MRVPAVANEPRLRIFANSLHTNLADHMRRAVIIFLSVLFGSVGLLWAYLAIDIDPDDQSPKVAAPSYQSLFEEAVRKTAKKEYRDLDQTARRKVLTTLAGAKSGVAVREVALHRLRDLVDKDAALAVIKKELPSATDDQYEAAIGTVAAMNTPAATAFLESLWKALDASSVASTPLGDYRYSTVVAQHATNGIDVMFDERSRLDADYSLSSVPEISLFLPNRPDYVVAIPNIDDVLGEFNTSRFAEALDGSPVPGDIWTLPLLRTIATLRSRLDESFGMLAPYFSPERFFKDQFLLARYGDHYLVACFKDKNLTVAEGVLSSFGRLGRDFGVSSWTAEGENVHTIKNRRSGRTLSFVVIGPYFVTATDSSLIGSAIRTYVSDRGASFGIDPLFASTYGAIDQSGKREVMYAWLSPSKVFEVTGSSDPSARRRAVVGRALGKELYPRDVGMEASRLAHRFADGEISGTLAGADPSRFWRYVVDVRSLGKNQLDSLTRVSGMDIGKEIVPYLGNGAAIRLNGLSHLKEPYGFSNTAYRVALAMPLAANTPTTFDVTFGRFLGRITSLQYSMKETTGGTARVWVGEDTTTSDTSMLRQMFRPSFAVVGGKTLVMATTPDELANALSAIAPQGSEPAPTPAITQGVVRVPELSGNAFDYATAYLLRTDRYLPDEIATRLNPLRTAFATIQSFSWSVSEKNGLRHGWGLLRNRISIRDAR